MQDHGVTRREGSTYFWSLVIFFCFSGLRRLLWFSEISANGFWRPELWFLLISFFKPNFSYQNNTFCRLWGILGKFTRIDYNETPLGISCICFLFLKFCRHRLAIVKLRLLWGRIFLQETYIIFQFEKIQKMDKFVGKNQMWNLGV